MASLETGSPRLTSKKFEGSPMRLYLTVACACCCTISFGFSIGYSSNAIPELEKAGMLTKDTSPWFGSLLTVGAMAGGPFAGYCIETFGRKITIMMTSLSFAIGGMMISFAQASTGLYVGRLICGLGCGMSVVCVPVYIAEVSTKSLRGLLGSCTQLSITIGITLTYALGILLKWNHLAIAGVLPAVLGIVTMFAVPETPRFLIMKKRKQCALLALAALRGPHVDVEDECRDIEEGLDFQENFSWSEFKKPELSRPLMVVLALMVLQQLTGINAVMFYAVPIFNGAGFKRSAEASVIIGVVQVIATGVSCLLMDRAGRRRLLIIAGSIMAVSCGMFGFYYWAKSSYSSLAIGSLVIYMIGFSLGWGPVPMLIMSELFPARARGSASGVAVFTSWFSAFVITQEFHTITTILGTAGTFWLFGVCCLSSVMFVNKYVPETKGKSLEDIELYFLGRATTY